MPAAAPVLLAFVDLAHVPANNDVNDLSGFNLAVPLCKVLSAFHARPVRVIQLVVHLNNGKLWLQRGAVAALRSAGLWLFLLAGFALAARCCLGALHVGKELLQLLQQMRAAVLPLGKLRQQDVDLGLQHGHRGLRCPRNLPELCWVLDVVEGPHTWIIAGRRSFEP